MKNTVHYENAEMLDGKEAREKGEGRKRGGKTGGRPDLRRARQEGGRTLGGQDRREAGPKEARQKGGGRKRGG